VPQMIAVDAENRFERQLFGSTTPQELVASID
jgi:hypothetical protein